MTRSISRFALCCAAVLATACGGGSDGGSRGVDVLFRVHAPDTTPAGAALYLAGDFNGWDPASAADRLAEVAPRVYELTKTFPQGTRLELKVTRGSWETVERDARGADVDNRVYDVLSPTTFDLLVGSWADASPSTITGNVTTVSIPEFLGGRRVWVYLPPGYEETGTDRHPVLYLLDGQNVFDRVTSFVGEWKVDEALEALIPAGEVAPLIVVAVDNGGSARIAEYTPWPDPTDGGGQGATHLAAIADVLVPWVDGHYRTVAEPASRGFGGSSLGGLMTLYAIETRPDVFGRGMAMSPSIWWDARRIVSYASEQAKPAAVVWVDMGTAEYDTGIADLHLMRDALVGQGFVVGEDLTVFEDAGAAHNETAWSRRFPDAMRFLFPAQ